MSKFGSIDSFLSVFLQICFGMSYYYVLIFCSEANRYISLFNLKVTGTLFVKLGFEEFLGKFLLNGPVPATGDTLFASADDQKRYSVCITTSPCCNRLTIGIHTASSKKLKVTVTGIVYSPDPARRPP